MAMESPGYVVKTWERQPADNKHVWAFIYFCQRQGDNVKLHHNNDGTFDVHVEIAQ